MFVRNEIVFSVGTVIATFRRFWKLLLVSGIKIYKTLDTTYVFLTTSQNNYPSADET